VPNQTWSEWSPPYQKKEEQNLSPKARYLQFKILFKTQNGNLSPSLQKTTLFYLQTNIAPIISQLDLLPANEVFLKLPEQDDVIWGVEKSLTEQTAKKDEGKILAMAKKVERKGFQTVIWDASDENGDFLLYTLSIRKEGEGQWRPLKEKWDETIFAFDTVSYPDGNYHLKIEASDSPSNPLGSELRTEKISQPLAIDNSLPLIKNFVAVRNKNVLEVSFLVEDSFSYIEEVKFLINPDIWRVVFPVDGICDSRQESFKFSVRLGQNSDNLITLKVKDNRNNIGVYRQTF
jgi:hypothetical protein